jgi:tripartite-type tricarboxylate transporter receptor subunit TctC
MLKFATAMNAVRSKLFPALVIACSALGILPMQRAQAAYPDRQITIIVCFPAGGGTDIAVRMINTQLGEALGKPVIIENRGGAGGNIGISAAARATPDGYTLLGCSSAFVVNPSLYAHVPYNALKDFKPLMLIGSSPNVLVVPAASKIKSIADLIEMAKANPGKLNWTSPGMGTTPQLAGELFKLRTGINIVHIPFPGAGPAMTAVLGGQVDMYAANYGSVSSLIQSGQVRAIAVTAKQRWHDVPDVPTLEELGIKNADTDTFQGLYVPAATPQPIIDKLASTLKEILARPDVKEKYEKIGLPVVAAGPKEFGAVIDHQLPMYKDVIEKAGLQVK